MNKFNYKHYKNCYFNVASYAYNKNAMAIEIENREDGPINTCTVFLEDGLYTPYCTVIKNYSEGSGMTKFLQDLGIVVEILNRRPCNAWALNSMNTDNPDSFDTCIIDQEKLKEYTKSWNYGK